MVNPGSPSTGQSSTTPLDGEYMSSQQLLDLLRNQRVIDVLEKNPTMILPLMLEFPFDQFITMTLRHEEPNIESDNMRSVKSKSSHSNKRACYNCGSKDHYVNKCPRPNFCRYCKSPGHLIPSCPKRSNKSKGDPSSNPSS